MRPFFPCIPNQTPSATLFHQVSGNLNNGLPNLRPMQVQSQVGFNPNPQNWSPFNNPTPNMGYFNQPALQNSHLDKSVLGSALSMPHSAPHSHGGFSLQGPNSVSGFLMSGSFGGLVAQNSNPGQLLSNGCLDGLNPNAGFVNGQLGMQNLLQNLNQLANLHLLNHSQLSSLAQIPGCGNQLAPGVIPQNPAFVTNPQHGLLQQIGALQQANLSQLNMFPSMVGLLQPMQMDSITSSTSGSCLPQQAQPMSLQANQGNRGELNVSNSNHRQNRHFKRGPSGGTSNPRNKFQKTQNQHAQEINGNKNERNHALQTSVNDFKGGKRRSLATLYTQQEIQQWREERRKNYPTKANVEKKLVLNGKNSEDAKNEAKLRRQQLKEILAKQAELGFEVPELPSHYLSDSEAKEHGRENRTRPLKKNEKFQRRPFNKNERFQNMYNNKRRRYDYDQNKWFGKSREGYTNSSRKNVHYASKKHRPELDNSLKSASLTTRKKPSLLEKLLATDTKRDNSHLLQVFRFLVMNSFLEDQSLEDNNGLKFPKVIVKEDASVVEGSLSSSPKEVISEVGSKATVEKLDGGSDDNNDSSDDDNDCCVGTAPGVVAKLDIVGEVTENYEAEEGEVTD